MSTVVTPQLSREVNNYAGILEIAEVPIIFWLVIAGAKEPKPA